MSPRAGKPEAHEDQQALRERVGRLEEALEQARVQATADRDELERCRQGIQVLRRSDDYYRQLVEDSNVGMFRATLDAPGRLIWSNHAGAAMHGYGLEEFIALPMSERYADPAERTVVMAELREKGIIRQREVHLRRRDGSGFWGAVTARLVRDESGEAQWIEGIVQDISDRKNAELALLRSEENLRAILSSFHETCVAVYDAQGNILNVWIDPKLLERYGLTLDRVVGGTLYDIHSREMAQTRIARIREVLATGRSVRDEYLTHYPRGSYWMETTLSPMCDAGGQARAVVAFIRDVTDRKRAEESLRQAHRMLVEARENERRRLAAELHDSVGQDLVAMQLFISTRLAGEGAGEAAAPHLAELASRCTQLVKEIRGICYGLFPATLEALGLAVAIQDLARPYRDSAQKITVTVAQSLQGRRLGGDVEIALFRIAQEALSNAVRHGKATRVGISLGRTGTDMVLAVTDDGGGFDVEAATNKGLGLGTMAERAGALGGRLEVASRPGRTCVRAVIPAGKS